MTKLGYTDYEEGYRHGRRDFAAGLISNPTAKNNPDEYWCGYRDGMIEQQETYREWLANE